MKTQADKSQDNKNQSVSAAESLKQSGSESAFQFVDNRPEALAQRKMQEMADNRVRIESGKIPPVQGMFKARGGSINQQLASQYYRQ